MTDRSDPSMDRDVLLDRLAREAYRFGHFTLASGRSSDHYVNCKPVALSGSGLALLSPAMLALVDEEAVAVGGPGEEALTEAVIAAANLPVRLFMCALPPCACAVCMLSSSLP